MNDKIDTWSEQEISRLRAVAAAAIPASSEFAVPGADDPTIFAEVLAEMRHEAAAVREALQHLDAFAGGAYDALAPDARTRTATDFQRLHPSHALCLLGAILCAYYRDDRVMRAMGMEPRPPFPRGFEIPQGDWSLLEPVRSGPIRYRAVRPDVERR